MADGGLTVLPPPEEEPPARPTPPSPSSHSQRIRTPDHLEVVREAIEPDLVQAQPQLWKRIGQEVSRRLDYQPGKFFWQETVRPKYVRLDDKALPPVMAPAPAQALPHALAAPGLVAQTWVNWNDLSSMARWRLVESGCGAVSLGAAYLLSATFVWRCLTSRAVLPFPHPAHRTGRL